MTEPPRRVRRPSRTGSTGRSLRSTTGPHPPSRMGIKVPRRCSRTAPGHLRDVSRRAGGVRAERAAEPSPLTTTATTTGPVTTAWARTAPMPLAMVRRHVERREQLQRHPVHRHLYCHRPDEGDPRRRPCVLLVRDGGVGRIAVPGSSAARFAAGVTRQAATAFDSMAATGGQRVGPPNVPAGRHLPQGRPRQPPPPGADPSGAGGWPRPGLRQP